MNQVYPTDYEKDPMGFCLALTQLNPRDERAWDYMNRRLKKFFYQFALRNSLTPEETEDTMQNTVMIFLDAIASGKFTCKGFKPIGYVGRICVNLWHDHLKKAKKYLPMIDIADFTGERETNEPDDWYKLTDNDMAAHRASERAFAELTPANQELMWRHYVDGQKFVDFAKEDGYTDMSVRQLHQRAKKQFNTLFDKHFNAIRRGESV
ncbi:RNA polymerase sigma factor [Spirosoma fluviale]|uniref:RNA polymerase sigma factor, sigma-70 family n=1 Tax=Spirosoma fluviale TaxID=1597977 RepID=A0A286GX91_9BACT|nr:sigma-70 family RNA polymerase sigma factor [Spirosoma fluviale]SOD99699.1 RNA polymerase sigma factor, sigma-70 family [Spirosoma fluviale]